MRITQGLVYQNARAATSRAREAAEAAQYAATTGSRIRHPGSDPAGSAQMVALGINAERHSAIAKATGTAYDELQLADSALSTVNDALDRARQLAVQFSNSSYNATQASGAAAEVQGIIGRVVAAMNSRFANRYIFGGTKDDAPPFDAAGNYSGDAGVRQVEVAPGVLQATNVRADVHLKGSAGGVDVFAVLSQLQGALSTYTPTGVQATLNGLDDAMAQILGGDRPDRRVHERARDRHHRGQGGGDPGGGGPQRGGRGGHHRGLHPAPGHPDWPSRPRCRRPRSRSSSPSSTTCSAMRALAEPLAGTPTRRLRPPTPCRRRSADLVSGAPEELAGEVPGPRAPGADRAPPRARPRPFSPTGDEAVRSRTPPAGAPAIRDSEFRRGRLRAAAADCVTQRAGPEVFARYRHRDALSPRQADDRDIS